MNKIKKPNKFILGVMVYSSIVSLVVQSMLFYIYGKDIPVVTLILTSQLILIGLPSLIYFLINKDIKIPMKKLSLKQVLLIFGLAITIMPLLNLINVLSQFFVKNNVAGLMVNVQKMPLIATIALIALLPAVLEEILTRGIIINNYKNQTVLATIIISGLFFGFIHMNINQFLYAFVMGIIMCYVVLVTRSIFASMIIHFVINSTGVLLMRASIAILKMASEINGQSKAMDNLLNAETPSFSQLVGTSITLLVIAAITLPIGALIVKKLLDANNQNFKQSLKMTTAEFLGEQAEQNEVITENVEVTTTPKTKVIDAYLIISSAIFIVFALVVEILSKQAM